MTCIAWDGKELVGDRLADYGGTPLITCKVEKVTTKDGHIYLAGHAGNWNFCHAYLAWMKGHRADKPQLPSGESVTFLLVDVMGQLYHVESSLEIAPLKARDKFHAIGSGRGEAIGAMAMGASARKAVQIASRYNTGVGMGIDVVKFK